MYQFNEVIVFFLKGEGEKEQGLTSLDEGGRPRMEKKADVHPKKSNNSVYAFIIGWQRK